MVSTTTGYGKIEHILHSKDKPKRKQAALVGAILSNEIALADFFSFFKTGKDSDKGACADALKHISASNPALLAPYLDVLIEYINHPLPRVKWGVPEAIGNLAKDFPGEVEKAIPGLLKNTTGDEENSTVIRWCAAYSLGEIARYNPAARKKLIPVFEDLINQEQNTGVKNVYIKAMKAINKDSSN
jgi:HEAT repeat protein